MSSYLNSNSVQRISGNFATHKVIFNPLLSQYRIVSIGYSRGRNWVIKTTGTEDHCDWYIRTKAA